MQVNQFSEHTKAIEIGQSTTQAMGAAASQSVTLGVAYTSTDTYDVYLFDNTTKKLATGFGVVKNSNSNFTIKTYDGNVSSDTLLYVAIGY